MVSRRVETAAAAPHTNEAPSTPLVDHAALAAAAAAEAVRRAICACAAALAHRTRVQAAHHAALSASVGRLATGMGAVREDAAAMNTALRELRAKTDEIASMLHASESRKKARVERAPTPAPKKRPAVRVRACARLRMNAQYALRVRARPPVTIALCPC